MSVNKRLKHKRRPKKKAPEKLRRQKAQKKRLVSLGMASADAEKIPPHKVRAMVRKPAATAKRIAKAAAKAAASDA